MAKTFTIKDSFEHELQGYLWESKQANIKGVIQIVHGAGEHVGRYDYFAKKCNQEGYHVVGNDLLGHGLSESKEDRIFFANKDGYLEVYDGIKSTRDWIHGTYPELKVHLFGHSMGSLFGRFTMIQDSDRYESATFTGSGFFSIPALRLGQILAWFIATFKGKEHISMFFNHKVNEGHIRKMMNSGLIDRKVDWLSQDVRIVNQFINDPLCGKEFTIQAQRDLMKLITEIQIKTRLSKGATSTPIMLMSGDLDGLGDFGKGIKKLVDCMLEAGYSNISYKILNDCRHEVVNEIEKDSYIAHILNFINKNNKGA